MALLASDLNLRFEKLFKKFGNGKEVPVKFYNGQDISNGLLTNIDHLLEEDDENDK